MKDHYFKKWLCFWQISGFLKWSLRRVCGGLPIGLVSAKRKMKCFKNSLTGESPSQPSLFSLCPTARLNSQETIRLNSPFRKPTETINCQLIKAPQTPHERGSGSYSKTFFFSLSSSFFSLPATIHNIFRFPPAFRGSAYEVRR